MSFRNTVLAGLAALGMATAPACVIREEGKDTGCANVNAKLKAWEECVEDAAACQEKTRDDVKTCLDDLAKKNPAYKPDEGSCVMQCES